MLQIRQHREQCEERRQDVLALRHPDHRLYLQGMQPKQGSCHTCHPRRGAEHQGERKDQRRVPGVQQHVRSVVGGRRLAPEPILDPVGGEDERVIREVLRHFGRRPDLLQAGRGPNGVVADYVDVIVPVDEAVAQCRHVRRGDSSSKRERSQQRAQVRRRCG